VYIDNKDDFRAFIKRAKSSDILCIDTEFLREKTYYAKLCLLQLATREEIVLVDPLKVLDLTDLGELLVNPAITKVFHACHQDVEILYHEIGLIPKPIFDTQIAAAFLGDAQQVGLANLVSKICSVTLKKTDSFTDWSKRPLSESQLSYAQDDVRYLPQVYDELVSSLKETNRLHWLDEDFEMLSDPKRYEEDASMRYTKLKRNGHLNRRQLSAAREVGIWREEYAQLHNIPRKWVLTDEQIVEMCRKETANISDLLTIRGVRDRLNTAEARNVAECIKKGLTMPEELLPEIDSRKHNEPNVDSLVDIMLAIARMRAKENNVALQTLASHDALERLARGHRKDNELLHGWRRAMLGNELTMLLEGKLSIHIDENNLVINKHESV